MLMRGSIIVGLALFGASVLVTSGAGAGEALGAGMNWGRGLLADGVGTGAMVTAAGALEGGMVVGLLVAVGV